MAASILPGTGAIRVGVGHRLLPLLQTAPKGASDSRDKSSTGRGVIGVSFARRASRQCGRRLGFA
jgi:hypothetical protein